MTSLCIHDTYDAAVNKTSDNRKLAVLRAVFLIGAVADSLIAIEWYLIGLGLVDMPISGDG